MRRNDVRLAVLLGLSAQSTAVSAEFCADRPGLATGTCIVEAGKVQLETSFVEWSRTISEEGEETDWLLGASRLRIGLGSETDLQVAFTPFIDVRVRGDEDSRASGVSDVTVAVKKRIVDGSGFSLAALPFTKIPIAKEPIGNRKWEGGMLIPMEFSLTDGFSLTLTPEIDLNADADGSGHHVRTAVAASLGIDVGEHWSVALDGLWARERDEGVAREAIVGLSVARQIGSNAQLDAEVDTGLTRHVADWRVSSGFAVRF